uniref:Endonuclease/exonuclease/phosphatase domain-containing protein n=1 Tax=Mucochytrium quahogii TaxID=96639 RepID=A0A7S2RUX0_9STRA|mmetsp:Transcript_24278/g.39381  ORF Transcript_24278/g.39381 Transcript_24278/m.39381 type:complete len:377 (+) Transcript_24278:219-1349(+)
MSFRVGLGYVGRKKCSMILDRGTLGGRLGQEKKKWKKSKMEMESLNVLSFNIRYVLDRWGERKELVSDVIRGHEDRKHDVFGLQEVCVGGSLVGQDASIRREFTDMDVSAQPCFPSYFGEIPYVGFILAFIFNSPLGWVFRDLYALFNTMCLERILSVINGPMLFHTPILGDLFYLLLGSGWSFGNLLGCNSSLNPESFPPLLLGGKYRTAQKTKLMVPKVNGDTQRVWVVNTHLSDTPGFPSEELLKKACDARVSEFLRIVAWLESEDDIESTDAIIIMGDMNSTPDEPLHNIAAEHGFKSAHKYVHGFEPSVTFHQNHQCATKDLGHEECLDYVFFRGPLEATSCQVVGNKSHVADSTLYPSDHYGLSVNFKLV